MTLESTLYPSASFSADMIPRLIVSTVTWGFHGQSHSWIPAEAFPASGSTTLYPLTAVTHTRCSIPWVTISNGSWHGAPVLQLG